MGEEVRVSLLSLARSPIVFSFDLGPAFARLYPSGKELKENTLKQPLATQASDCHDPWLSDKGCARDVTFTFP